MSKYSVKEVVCDYGIYEGEDLKLILNSRKNALNILSILIADEVNHKFPYFLNTLYGSDSEKIMGVEFENIREALKIVKTRIASDIFSEIDTLIVEYFDGLYNTREFIDIFNELRNKYTEGNNDTKEKSSRDSRIHSERWTDH